MLLDGQALELVHDILQVIPVDGWSVRNALTDAVSDVCQHFRYTLWFYQQHLFLSLLVRL